MSFALFGCDRISFRSVAGYRCLVQLSPGQILPSMLFATVSVVFWVASGLSAYACSQYDCSPRALPYDQVRISTGGETAIRPVVPVKRESDGSKTDRLFVRRINVRSDWPARREFNRESVHQRKTERQESPGKRKRPSEHSRRSQKRSRCSSNANRCAPDRRARKAKQPPGQRTNPRVTPMMIDIP